MALCEKRLLLPAQWGKVAANPVHNPADKGQLNSVKHRGMTLQLSADQRHGGSLLAIV